MGRRKKIQETNVSSSIDTSKEPIRDIRNNRFSSEEKRSFRAKFTSRRIGRTHINKDFLDPEYEYLWAIENGKNMENIANLEENYWEKVYLAEIPQLTPIDEAGNPIKGTGLIRRGEYILMKRHKEIHEEELDVQKEHMELKKDFKDVVDNNASFNEKGLSRSSAKEYAGFGIKTV